MIKINIPASKAMNGEIAPNRIVTAPPLVCASAEPVVLMSKRPKRTRCISVTIEPPSAHKIAWCPVGFTLRLRQIDNWRQRS